MRVAVVSDIHANLHALEAAERDMEDHRIDEVWCLGDVVGYGAFPRECLQWVEKRAHRFVKGNHDQAVAAGDVEWFNPIAADAARFHAQVLDPSERARLYAWPHEARVDIDGERVLLVHASPDDPLREYVMPENARDALDRWEGLADVLLLGHTHMPFVASRARDGRSPGGRGEGGQRTAVSEKPAALRGRGPWRETGFDTAIGMSSSTDMPDSRKMGKDPRAAAGEAHPGQDSSHVLIVNPGSVGQPRDHDARASYAILDFTTRHVSLRRVAYDVDAASEAILALGLPTPLAMRLLAGR